MEQWVRFGALVLPVVLGVLSGRLRLFDQPEHAIAVLNRYALYVAFPALVLLGVADSTFETPAGIGFWATPVLSLATTLGLLYVASAWIGTSSERGTLALVASFGNVAYLGLPIVQAGLGPGAMGTAALAVAVYLTLSLLVGPLLLLRWSPDAEGSLGSPLAKVMKLPLLWAPLMGFLVQRLSEGPRSVLMGVLEPVGLSAGPVALFLIGLYVHTHRQSVSRPRSADLRHGTVKLILCPLVTAGWASVLIGLESESARVLILLSAMPVAITTFALSQEFQAGTAMVARTIVLSTLASASTLPLILWLLDP